MTENIDKYSYHNRKLIIEIRYRPNLLFLDRRGVILEDILKLNLSDAKEVGYNDKSVNLTDHLSKKEVRTEFFAEAERFAFISSNYSSVKQFYADFEKILEVVFKHMPNLKIRRIGCRVQGTYRTRSTAFNAVLRKFKHQFKEAFFLDEFSAKDFLLTVNYENGRYHLGPVDKGDQFILKNFSYAAAKHEVGFGMDIDSHILYDEVCIPELSKELEKVVLATLSVEKALVAKLKDF